MEIPANTSSPANAAYLAQVSPITDSKGNVQEMVAEMLSESSKLNKEAKPTGKEQEIAYIERALSQSIDSNSFEANMQFWQGLKNSLPKDSPFLSYAIAQLDLFTNNSALQKLEAQGDEQGIEAQKNIINAQSRALNRQISSRASGVMNVVNQENNNAETISKQTASYGALIAALIQESIKA